MPGWSSRMIRALDTQLREVPRSNRGSGHILRSLIILSSQFLVERSNFLIEAFQRGGNHETITSGLVQKPHRGRDR